MKYLLAFIIIAFTFLACENSDLEVQFNGEEKVILEYDPEFLFKKVNTTIEEYFNKKVPNHQDLIYISNLHHGNYLGYIANYKESNLVEHTICIQVDTKDFTIEEVKCFTELN